MFDFAWTEIALIGVVALVAIGPKDLPVAIKAVAQMVKKARRMASEFQTHVDEMVREANLDEVRSQISQIRNLDIKGTIERAVDSDGSIRRTFTEDPLKSTYKPAATATPFDSAAATATASEMGHAAPDTPLVTPAPAEPVMAGPLSAEPAFSDAGATRTMERPTYRDAAAGSQGTPAPRPAPAFIPPSIAVPPVPPAFIPPNTPRPYA